MSLIACFTLSVILVTVFCLYCKKKYSYWREKGVKGPVPWPVVGNFGNVILQKESLDQCIKDIYSKYKGEKLVGLYSGFRPVVLIRDPELIKHVLIRDFDVFQERGNSSRGSRLSDNLFSANGEKWKIMRQKLTPVFTTRKLKEMVPNIQKCIANFLQYVNNLVEKNIDHEIRALTAKYTLEVIGSCAFGLDLKLYTDEENKFSSMAKQIFTPTFRSRLIVLLDMIIPGIRKKFSTRPELQEFFVDLVRKVQKERKGRPLSHRDFMDLMIELKEEGKISRKLEDGKVEIEIDDYMVAAQALVFYSAGFETSSAAMSFLIHELALHTDVQDRLYKEICEVLEKYDGEINYDSVKDMKYLEMVLDETLRKHSLATVLFRKSSLAYTFPGTDVTIPKDTSVMISASGLTKDPKYFNNPNEFNPENFMPEKLNNLPQCVYLPFGEGPRNCIGMRFAKVQSLLGTAAFFKQFKVEPSEKTKQELVMDPKAIVVTCKEGIWVKITKR
ncbi:unnamed protein product [Chilo suppressalis]|uniref:unspecific monooxygenase n=1 Tax=Chilo suppressalis TaxID=168631 RepID=A0A0U4DI13_CHISP|nr:CYP6CV5 [Chilo suppressalis]RVE54617.1 hypothetical protein evm_000738 [Chilo suppressalis]CAH0399766.1 unnamed protein product [Chilo suppressalis]